MCTLVYKLEHRAIDVGHAIYEANLARVEAHNAAGHSWTMAMNEFGDLTPQEFAHGRIGGYVPR